MVDVVNNHFRILNFNDIEKIFCLTQSVWYFLAANLTFWLEQEALVKKRLVCGLLA